MPSLGEVTMTDIDPLVQPGALPVIVAAPIVLPVAVKFARYEPLAIAIGVGTDTVLLSELVSVTERGVYKYVGTEMY